MKECYNNSTIGFSSQAPTNQQRGESSLFIQEMVKIPRRGAHGLLKEGAPSVSNRAAKCGEWAATSPHFNTSVNSNQSQEEGATSLNHGLPPQEGATSPRGAHLSNSHMLKSKKISKSITLPINLILSPLTI
jgi:hypothetical protein